MYFIQLKKTQFFYLLIALVLLIGFWGIVKAEEDYFLLDEDSLRIDNEVTEQTSQEDSSPQVYKRTPIQVEDSFFIVPKGISLNNFASRVCFVVFVLVGVLILVKFFLARNQFNSPGSLLENLAQKVSNTFASFSGAGGLKLIQTLILTPGQNLYVVEAGERKLLLGGTQYGGVQFLADLTKGDSKEIASLSFKQMEQIPEQIHAKPIHYEIPQEQATQKIEKSFNLHETPFVVNQITDSNGSSKLTQSKSNLSIEPLPSTAASYSTQALKRRISFRQSLLK